MQNETMKLSKYPTNLIIKPHPGLIRVGSPPSLPGTDFLGIHSLPGRKIGNCDGEEQGHHYDEGGDHQTRLRHINPRWRSIKHIFLAIFGLQLTT